MPSYPLQGVTVVVSTPARAELIDRTIESISGLRRVVVHLYTATAPLWRNTVIGEDREALLRRIRDAAERIACAVDGWDAEARFEFSPEIFSLTEPGFALEVCNMVMHRNLDRREAVILSAHPHNDRGTGVVRCARSRGLSQDRSRAWQRDLQQWGSMSTSSTSRSRPRHPGGRASRRHMRCAA